jgi:cytochrome P450
MRGNRHIWLWHQFQTYGPRVRPTPDSVVFCDPGAYADIYSSTSNVRRSRLYTAYKRNEKEHTTFNTVDVKEHARRRKLLSLCFTEKSLQAAMHFVISHVDRWIEIIAGDICPDFGWSETVDLSTMLDALILDILGDLCFGRSFNIKEPWDNPLKLIPHSTSEYMRFYYPVSPTSRMLNLLSTCNGF